MATLSSLVHLAAMADGDHHDDQDVVMDGVDDAIVADSQPVTGTTNEPSGSRRAGILGQQGNRALNARPNGGVDSA
jgi:hypothetical protein